MAGIWLNARPPEQQTFHHLLRETVAGDFCSIAMIPIETGNNDDEQSSNCQYKRNAKLYNANPPSTKKICPVV
jgi:hypothetical protein